MKRNEKTKEIPKEKTREKVIEMRGGTKKKSDKLERSENEDQKCAPARKYDGVSCLSTDELNDMANAWNKYVEMKMIDKNPINMYNDKRGIAEQLKDRLNDVCKDQLCWISQEFVNHAAQKHQIQKKAFLPEAPEGKFDWLSTSNISEYIDQLHDVFKDFKYLGTVPMDFDDIGVGIKNLNYAKLYNEGVRRLGIIFNTDVSSGRGMHWIALFVDLGKKKIYFSDSVGKQPDMRVVALVDRIAKWMLTKYYHITMDTNSPYMRASGKNNIEKSGKLDIRWNTMGHQKENSECGVYSMHFILAMLQGVSFEKYNSKRISDKEINKFRKVFFTVRT